MTELHLEASPASISVDAVQGGRLSSLNVAGLQLLVIEATLGSLQWGAYPMVPWAGRIRDGRFGFGTITHDTEPNLPPHSAHGVGFTSPWEIVDDQTIALDMADRWPFGGLVSQRFDLDPNGLTITMAVEAVEEMPVMVGWHPWFARSIDGPDGLVEAELSFGPAEMYELDDSAIPTGTLVEPPRGPWDNCFTSLAQEPTISWPGLLDLKLSSSCDHWVIYTEPADALCVEPQSDAPDAFNRSPTVLGVGERVEEWFRLDWHRSSPA